MHPLLALLFPLALAPAAHAGSVGKVEAGSLTGAEELPVEGAHHFILPRRHRVRGLRWGTRPLVRVLLEAARVVAEKFPGSRLGVGNLSRRSGGRIRFSRSHQSGRDADLAFYMTDRKGQPIDPVDLVTFNRRGRAAGGARFDVPRNWALVEALLASPEAKIQWLLIARPLRRMLLEHARKVGAPEDVIRRAAKVLHQPRWALPHNDHLHVRIYCPREDVGVCVDTGPRWPWIAAEQVPASSTD